MSTIFDVAKKANVSVVTVSRLLNNPKIVSTKTAEKIFQVMEKLHYQPSQIARSLVGKKTNTVGVIMPDIKNTFFNSWFRYVEEYASVQGINLVLCNTDEDETKEMKYIKLLQSQRVDGIIIAAHSVKTVEYLLNINMHFVLFDRIFKDYDVNFVTTDHYQGSFDATEYLIRLGHKRIVVLRGPGILYADVQRYAAFEDAMKKHKLAVEKNLIINCEWSEEKAFNAVPELFKMKERPTVIFSFSGLMTKGVIKALQSLHLSLPKDISLIGYDEIPGQDIFQPRITHVLQPINDLGKESIVNLLAMIKNNSQSRNAEIFLKPKLVIGESCLSLN